MCMVYHMFVVSNTGVKGKCLHAFLMCPPKKNAVRNFFVFDLINNNIIIFVLTKSDFGTMMENTM